MDVHDLAAAIPPELALFDFEAVFNSQYKRIARLIAQVVKDPARAEELCAEVFYKLWRANAAAIGNVNGWLHKTAVRTALDDLRRQCRREKYEHILQILRPTVVHPDQYAVNGEAERVRRTLAALKKRHSELLILRNEDFSYQEIAATLAVKPEFVGTLLSRAQQAFRKEYIKRYGKR